MATRVKNHPGSPDYRHDGYGWAMAQAALIRAGRLSEVDWENVAEEVESVGKSEYAKLESAARVLLLHLLKWDHQPERRTRSWVLTIKEQRARFEQILRQNPGLKPEVGQAVADAFELARIGAAREMDVDDRLLPAANPYDLDALLTSPRSLDDAGL
jgi:hypothetical protein